MIAQCSPCCIWLVSFNWAMFLTQVHRRPGAWHTRVIGHQDQEGEISGQGSPSGCRTCGQVQYFVQPRLYFCAHFFVPLKVILSSSSPTLILTNATRNHEFWRGLTDFCRASCFGVIPKAVFVRKLPFWLWQGAPSASRKALLKDDLWHSSRSEHFSLVSLDTRYFVKK